MSLQNRRYGNLKCRKIKCNKCKIDNRRNLNVHHISPEGSNEERRKVLGSDSDMVTLTRNENYLGTHIATKHVNKPLADMFISLLY